jgi:death-on-curing protein
MKCLSLDAIVLLHNKAVTRHGGDRSALSRENREKVEDIQGYIEGISQYKQLDKFEYICIAIYQLVKGHYFLDGNKRTATLVLLNCLKDLGYKYTGEPKDLANKIIAVSQSDPKEKEETVSELSYFIRMRLQVR